MGKIWTSRFSNPALQSGAYTVVGIVRYLPKYPLKYTLAGNIIDIAPPRWLFNEYDRKKFTEPYCRNLDKIGFPIINEQIHRYLGKGKDVVLCCYEDVRKQDEWCHRLVFAEWWARKTGEIIHELKDTSQIKGEKKPPKFEQVSLL